MAETAGSLATALSRRIRDPNNTAHSLTVVYDILSHCQRLVNAATDAKRSQVTFVHNGQTPTAAIFSNGLFRVSEIRIGKDAANAPYGTPLPQMNWKKLAAKDPYWYERRDHHPRFWDVVGQNPLLLWPQWAGQLYVAARTLANTATLTGASDITELPDQHMPQILNLAETVLLLRQRLLASVAQSAERSQRVGQGLAVP